jgi:hypothetical protein
MHSQLIAAADPAPFNKPRFISWPSVCDTTRTNWLAPEDRKSVCATGSASDPPSPALQNHINYACMVDLHSEQPIDPRVLAACSAIDCIAPSADPILTFTAVATPSWNPSLNLGPWTFVPTEGLKFLGWTRETYGRSIVRGRETLAPPALSKSHGTRT